jgi:hypothetical protein
MRWFRLNTRPATWLAFLALALQFTLSFGHLHTNEWRHASIERQHAVVASLKLGSSDTPAAPVQQDSDGFCAICASITLAGSLVLPTPPAHALPPSIDRARSRAWSRLRDDRHFKPAHLPPPMTVMRSRTAAPPRSLGLETRPATPTLRRSDARSAFSSPTLYPRSRHGV